MFMLYLFKRFSQPFSLCGIKNSKIPPNLHTTLQISHTSTETQVKPVQTRQTTSLCKAGFRILELQPEVLYVYKAIVKCKNRTCSISPLYYIALLVATQIF